MVPEENGRNGPFTSDTVETLVNWANTMVGMAETWYQRPKRQRASENGRNGPFTSDTVETLVNWANTMVGMAETWYRRPKRQS